MRKNKSAFIVIAVIVIVLVVLFSWPKFTDPTRAMVKKWNSEDIDCLPSHTNANLHIHPLIRILIDNREEIVPANVGIVRSCMAEIHTHAADGVIHLESVDASKEFRFLEFLTVWGKKLERPSYKLTITVDGKPDKENGNFKMADKQQIILNYVSIK